MHSKPKIFNSNNLSTKVYVEFYIDEKRYREYSGRSLGLKLSPNTSTNIRERTSVLNTLRTALSDALHNGTYIIRSKYTDPTTLEELVNLAMSNKLAGNLSASYTRDLTYIKTQFLEFLSDEEKLAGPQKLEFGRLEMFLSRYTSSNTYYMNKRTTLAALLSEVCRIAGYNRNLIQGTVRRKSKAKLHVAYKQEQVKPLLDFIRLLHPQLYLCCLLTYCTWLRPHIEIRSLNKRHFNKDCSTITLSGSENKGGRVRVVFIPEYAREVLTTTLNAEESGGYLFGGDAPVNKDYFKTAWSRIRIRMVTAGLLEDNQTIYSFRHTAAVLMYRKTKDIYLLQKLLGHSSVLVTQKYLRSLGEVSIEELRNAAPEL